MLLVAAACGDVQPTGPSKAGNPLVGLQVLDCKANVALASVSCSRPLMSGPNLNIVGGQNTNVRLTSSNVTADGGTGIFQFEVTVQNLLNEAMGTPDGVTLDTAGISVFFFQGPTVTSGTGTVAVANADGTREFNAPNQPFFRYNEILSKDEVSAVKTWQLVYDPGVQTFTFRVYVAAELQPLLVINELLANPAGACPPVCDASAEWFEVYNAGSLEVEMQGMVVADSAPSGRRPYHLIGSSLIVPAGGYVVLGNSTNTTSNGGVPVDYAYGSALALANSLDALKISRVYGASDTLTIDRTQYASAAISAQNGISRELINPALDNSNMDGSNWADALVTAVYGPGGRGTPKAQNSTYTP